MYYNTSMLDFVFIILIFLEIFGLYFAIIKILEFNKKIQELNESVIEYGKVIIEVHKKIQTTMHKINWFVSIVTNKKIWQIKRIISTLISVIELIIILKSFNFKKGMFFNIKNVKKLLFTAVGRQIIKKIINTFALC